MSYSFKKYSEVTNTNIVASDVLLNKIAGSKQGAITGTMPNNGETGTTITSQGGTYTIPSGYTSGGTVTATLPTLTITNNTSGGTSTGTINRGSQIKIGVGYNSIDTYYTAQSNSGTVSVTAGTSSSTVSCDGYENVTVNPTPSETQTATANGTITPSSGKLLSSVTVNIPSYDGTVVVS